LIDIHNAVLYNLLLSVLYEKLGHQSLPAQVSGDEGKKRALKTWEGLLKVLDRLSNRLTSVAKAQGIAFIFLAFLITLVGQSVKAQSNASVSGLVTDPSGSAVPNVQITLTNEQTQTTQRATSDSTGFYSVPFVQQGEYTLAAIASGFKRFEQNAITVATAAKLTVDVHLQIGSANESVTVSGSGVEINATDAAVSTVVSQQFVENIPLNGRSFQSLISAVPGVNYVGSGSIQIDPLPAIAVRHLDRCDFPSRAYLCPDLLDLYLFSARPGVERRAVRAPVRPAIKPRFKPDGGG
jgi:hypothetical protein